MLNEILEKIKYRYFIFGGLLGLCAAVVIGFIFPTNDISVDIALIFGLYIYPFLYIVKICRENNFEYWRFLKPVKFQPVKELMLPIVMVELLNFGVLFFVAALMLKFLSGTGFDDTSEVSASWNPIMSFLTLIVFAPFFEEVIFRGYLFNKLAIRKSPLKALILSSLIFGILHLENAVPTTIIGIVLCMVFMKYKSLFPCFIIHLLHNTLVFLIKFSAQGTADTSVAAELPDAEMLLVFAAVLIGAGSVWFVSFIKSNRQYVGGISCQR